MKKTISLLSILGGLFAASTAQAAYQLVDLSFLEDPSVYASAYSSRLNDSNGVAGQNSGNPTHWTELSLQTLGSLGGTEGRAFGVNNAGNSVGFSEISQNYWHATMWNSAGNPTDLKGIDETRNSEAYAINNAGDAVGWSYNNADNFRATLWSGSKIVDLGAVSGNSNSEAYGINNASNKIVGFSEDDSNNRTATIWDFDGSNSTATNLGAGEAYAINDSGIIVGVSGNDFAARWDGTTLSELDRLGSLSSTAYDINSAGLIVGEIQTNAGYRGVLWNGTAATDINKLLDPLATGWLITNAFSINEAGNILAYAKDSAGNSRTVLLFNASAAAVPETSTYLMLLAGLCLISLQRSRFKKTI